MRKFSFSFLLVLLSLLGCQSSKKGKAPNKATSMGTIKHNALYKPFSEFKGDTLQYLTYNFMEHKDQYIGKTFPVLLHDLEIPVRSSVAGSDHNNGNASPSISLAFYDTDTEIHLLNSLGLVPTSYSVSIRWENPVSTEDYFKLYEASDINWNSGYEALFAGQIVNDVDVLKYANRKFQRK